MIKYPLIFTDLDGTLLNYFSYSFKPAAPLLDNLAKRGIPVIMNSSRNATEVVYIREQMGNRDPFIVENGAAVYLPKWQFPVMPDGCSDAGGYWCFSIARPKEHWLQRMEEQFDSEFTSLYTPMSSMDYEEIEEITGFSNEDAMRATKREFSESMLFHGRQEDKKLLIEILEGWGGYVLEGGRFLHIGDRVSKGSAMQWLLRCFEHHFPTRHFQTFALGDSPNDVDMLETADYSVVVASPVHEAPKLEREDQVVYTKKQGPDGWAEAMIQLLKIPVEPE
jgi:mannosyl-3-phosphoglycerate phosphatase family protein